MNHKIRALREKLKSLNLEGMIVSNPANIRYLTNIQSEGTLLITRKEKLVATPFILGLILLTVGITFFTGYITFAVIVHFIIALILGTGAGLLCYGIYLIANKQTSNGVLNVVMGVVALVLAILYMAVPEFEKAFWIIVGIVIAVYGLLGLVFAIIEKKSK